MPLHSDKEVNDRWIQSILDSVASTEDIELYFTRVREDALRKHSDDLGDLHRNIHSKISEPQELENKAISQFKER